MQQFKQCFLPLALLFLAAPVWSQAPVVDIGSGQGSQASGQGSMQGELYRQLQQLRQEMMELRGLVEEQQHEIRQLKQQSLDRYIDLDRRLGAAGPGGAPQQLDSADTMLDSDTGLVSNNEQGELSAPIDTATAGASGQAAVATPIPDTDDSQQSAGDESGDYAKAYELVRNRQFDQAITAFVDYVQRYPDGRYTPNAWYWLGELYVAVKPQNLEAATKAFQKLLSDYPDNGKVPAAMYKLATVYYLDGQKDKSKDMLTHVIDRYSNTGNAAVQKSREFLRKNF